MHYKISLSLLRGFGVCLLFLSPAHAFLFTPANPNPGAGSIYLSYNGAQSQGNILAIDVKVNTLSSSTPAIGAAFDLDFSPSVLTYDSLLPGDFFERIDILNNGSVMRLAALQQGIPGKLLIGISQNYGDPGASGSGTLLTLKFRVASGAQILQSDLSFSNMNLIGLQRQLIAGLNWYGGQVVQSPLEITTPSLPETTSGAVYSATLQAQGGTAPYTWTIASGLPPGLSLISTTGEILGIASAAGNWTFTVTVRDVSNASATRALAIMVQPAPAIATTSVSNLYQDSASQGVTFGVTGGIAPYTWSITAGGLPTGLTLDAQTGTVSGTPTTPGIYAFTIRVTDALGIASSTAYQWVILAIPPGNVDFVTPGSVNRVDGYDLIALDMVFGTTAGSPEWDPLADLNGDGIIDDADFSILQGSFGKSNGQ